jgi:uncharacterized protein YbjT (DUF2867 family)
MSEDKPFFVCGATGRHGGTGPVVVRELLKKGARVRALARVDDERAATLRGLGADVVIGDLHDHRTLRDSLEGVEAAYFTYPMKSGDVDAEANFAAAARAAGVPRVVIMSAVSAGPAHPSPLARAKWLVDQVMEWAGLPYVSLHVAAWFHENLALLHGADIRADGVIRNAIGDVPIPWIAGEDGGKVGAAALLHPERFGQDRVVYPGGTELFSFAEVATRIGEQIGKLLRHKTIPQREWLDRLLQLGAHDDRIDRVMAEHYSINAVVFSQARRPLPANLLGFEALTGEKPMTLASALATGKLSFEPQPAAGGERKVSAPARRQAF